MEAFVLAFVLAFATGACSITLSKTGMFHFYREWVAQRSDFLGHLVSCYYCTSHWIAGALVAIYQPRLVSSWLFVDLFVSWLAIVALSAVISGTILFLTPFATVQVEED